VAEIRWHNNPVVFSDSEPSPSMVIELSLWPATDWKWFNTSNLRWYDRVGSSWVMQGGERYTDTVEGILTKIKIEDGFVSEVEVDAEGITGTFTGTITKIVVKDGLVTEVELA